MLKELFPGEELEIRVVNPALASWGEQPMNSVALELTNAMCPFASRSTMPSREFSSASESRACAERRCATSRSNQAVAPWIISCNRGFGFDLFESRINLGDPSNA
ncbi:hypothetical protein ABIC02_007385 [Bradyrhizobium sp. RT5a]